MSMGGMGMGMGGMYMGGTPPRRQSGGIVKVIIILVVIICLVVSFQSCSASMDGFSVTKHQGLGKTAITPLAEFRADCVVDEDNWFADPYQVGKDLKTFYDQTGIQPYVLIHAPDSSLISDAMKESYADAWYSEHIEHEGALLYVYFAERNPDIEGYAVLIGGSATKAFFDSAATDAFWDTYDSYYFNTSISEEDLIVKTFEDTAEICLSSTTTTVTKESGLSAALNKLVIGLIVVVVIIIVVAVVLKLVKMKHERAAAQAAETERILNTPLEKLGDRETDDLLNKYK